MRTTHDSPHPCPHTDHHPRYCNLDLLTSTAIITAKLTTLTHLRLGTSSKTCYVSTLQGLPCLSQLTRLKTLHLNLSGAYGGLQVWKGVFPFYSPVYDFRTLNQCCGVCVCVCVCACVCACWGRLIREHGGGGSCLFRSSRGAFLVEPFLWMAGGGFSPTLVPCPQPHTHRQPLSLSLSLSLFSSVLTHTHHHMRICFMLFAWFSPALVPCPQPHSHTHTQSHTHTHTHTQSHTHSLSLSLSYTSTLPPHSHAHPPSSANVHSPPLLFSQVRRL